MLKEKDLVTLARKKQKTIVFPEAGFSEKMLNAAFAVYDKKIAKLILIGDESAMVLRNKRVNRFEIINPKTSELTETLAKALCKKKKDLKVESARALLLDPYYFGTMLVEEGYADGMLGGAEVETDKLLAPAFEVIKAEEKDGLISSCFLVLSKTGVFKDREVILSDCALNENPTSQELVQIADSAVKTAEALRMSPKVAFLSYSTHGSVKGEMAQKVQKAVKLFNNNKAIAFDGEIQFDAAVDENVAKLKCPNSPLKGQANVLIFPDRGAGNVCYKAIKYTSGAVTLGPIMQGLKKPVNSLLRSCTISDIVLMTAITVLQCKE